MNTPFTLNTISQWRDTPPPRTLRRVNINHYMYSTIKIGNGPKYGWSTLVSDYDNINKCFTFHRILGPSPEAIAEQIDVLLTDGYTMGIGSLQTPALIAHFAE